MAPAVRRLAAEAVARATIKGWRTKPFIRNWPGFQRVVQSVVEPGWEGCSTTTMEKPHEEDASTVKVTGAPNRSVVSQHPLPAPQATLISALAQGVIGGNLDWKMIDVGMIVGVRLSVLEAPMALVSATFAPGQALGLLGFAGLVLWLYEWMLRKARGQSL